MQIPRCLLRAAALALGFVACALCGCGPSRNILDIQPPPQPPLGELERHLDYVDPDDGQASYVIRQNR